MRSGIFKKVLCLFLSGLMIMPSSFALGAGKKDGIKANTQIMSENLRKEFELKDGIFDVIVKMKEEADLEKALIRAESFETDEPEHIKEKNAVVGELEDIAAETQQGLLTYLEKEQKKGNVLEFSSFFIVNAIHVKADKSVIAKISKNKKVERIDLNEKIYRSEPVEIADKGRVGFRTANAYEPEENQVEWNIKKINADRVWSEYGITGEGVTVGIMDSAVDYDHPALKNKFKGYNKETDSYDFKDSYKDAVEGKDRPSLTDNMEHGSHCAGIILGSEEVNGVITNQIGVAPGAKWINARVFGNGDNAATTDGFLTAAEWFLRPGGKTENAPDIINNSWGNNSPNSNSSDYFKDVVESWRRAGILPVFAAGNQGPGEPAPRRGSISNPANIADSFAVGAVDERGDLASFSKQGPSGIAGVDEFKPEVSAPGVHIRSAVKNQYGYMNGTSMAAPHVTGLAALLKSADRSLTPSQIENYIMETAEKRTNSVYNTAPNHGFGHGIINAYDAVSKLDGKKGVATLNGTVTAKGGVNVPANITITDTKRTVTANGTNGHYSMLHTKGSWTIKVSAKGFETVEERIELNTDMEKNFELNPKGRGEIKGTVKDIHGSSVSGAYVRVLEDADIKMVETDETGNFSLKDIYSGTYTLKVFKDRYENMELKVEVVGNETVVKEITLLSQADEDLIVKEEGEDVISEPSFFAYDNFKVDGYRNGGAAVRIEPSRKNGMISAVNINFHKGGYSNANKAILHLVEFDKEGRTKFLLKDLSFSFEPGKVKTIFLAEKQIKTSEPFFIVVTKKKTDPAFWVGIKDNGSSNASFIWQDMNLIPFEHTTDSRGALKMNATMVYQKDSDEVLPVVAAPKVFPIIPQDKLIRGILEENKLPLSNRTIAIRFQNGSRKLTVTDSDGMFKVGLGSAPVPGTIVSVSARAVNGMASKEVEQVVRNDYQNLENLIRFTKKTLEGVEDSEIKTQMESLLKTGEEIIKRAVALTRAETVDAGIVKELQKEIDNRYKEIKLLSADFYPAKKALMLLIEEIQSDFDEVFTSHHGNDIPTNRYWVTQLEWSNMRSAIMNARLVCDRDQSSSEEIDQAKRRLEDAKLTFDSVKKRGKKPVVIIDERYEDGVREGEGRGNNFLANHVVIEIKKGKLISIEISEWYETQAAKDAIETKFIPDIIDHNSLDIPFIKGYEKECESVIKAIKQALEKLLKDGYLPEIDKSGLMKLIDEAEKQLRNVRVSKKGDGSDIENKFGWVTEDENNSFSNDIRIAKEAYNNPKLSEDALKKASIDLTIAIAKFKSYIKKGVQDTGIDENTKAYELTTIVEGGGIKKAYELILKVFIKDNVITGMTDINTKPSKGSEYFHKKAFDGLKLRLIGLDIRKNKDLSDIHAISGATISSDAIKKLTQKAAEQHGESSGNIQDSYKEKLLQVVYLAKYELYVTKKSVDGSEIPSDKLWVSHEFKQNYINRIKNIIKEIDKPMDEERYKKLKADIDRAISELTETRKPGKK